MRRRWFLAGTVGGVERAARRRGGPRQRPGSVSVAMFAVAMLILGSCDSPNEGTPSTAGDPETTAEPSEPVARPTLRLAGEDSGFPSPFTYRRGPGYMYTQLQYETLLWKDASGELLPWLAEGFEVSDDGLTYTFDLRDDVTWQDGEPFTAEDVAFTFSYFEQNQDQISPQVIVKPPPGIEAVTATDELTVEFRLTEPLAIFLSAVAGAVPIAPEHIWSEVENPGEASDPALLVGTGPYRLESYSAGEGSYLYTANTDYFLGTPFVERIEYVEVGDALNALLTGEVAQVSDSGLRPDALAPFEADDTYDILKAPAGSSTLSLYWNLGQGGALADPDFRHATAMAINREDLVERLFGGNAVPGNPGWLPPDHPFYVEVEQWEYDLDAANALLDEAGYEMGPDGVRLGPDGEPLRFELLTATPPPPVVDVLVAALADVGVVLEPASLDTPSFNERVIAGNAEMSLIGAGGLNSDPDYLREVYSSQTKRTQHAQGYENARFDELAEQQLRTLDEEKRMEQVAEMQEIIAEDLPLLPLFYPDSVTIYNVDIFDEWYYTPGGVAVRIPSVENRHVFAIGRETGLEPRTAE